MYYRKRMNFIRICHLILRWLLIVCYFLGVTSSAKSQVNFPPAPAAAPGCFTQVSNIHVIRATCKQVSRGRAQVQESIWYGQQRFVVYAVQMEKGLHPVIWSLSCIDSKTFPVTCKFKIELTFYPFDLWVLCWNIQVKGSNQFCCISSNIILHSACWSGMGLSEICHPISFQEGLKPSCQLLVHFNLALDVYKTSGHFFSASKIP